MDAAIADRPVSGRVLLFLTRREKGEPRTFQRWLSREPVFAQDVSNLSPGGAVVLSALVGYPYGPDELPPGRYRAQAVMHVNPDLPTSGTAPGNLYGKPVEFEEGEGTSPVRLVMDRRIPEPPPPSNPLPYGRGSDKGNGRGSEKGNGLGSGKTDDGEPDTRTRTKAVKLRSALLSKFHGRDIHLRAAVILPEEYGKDETRRFPALYVIPGFGGDEHEATTWAMMLGPSKTPLVRVALSGMWAWGHHVYADSANNGPWNTALVEELIPHLEKTFRLVPEPRARLLTGHSSGGWSALWLQITRPDYFGGTWATSPDSVDFHDFCGINLYAPNTNFYVTDRGEPRPIVRRSGKVVLSLRDFVHQEDVIGRGGQMQSFEAVFGPRGADGRPAPMFDRRTGEIHSDVIKAWRRYDIVERLRRRWPTLGPKLSGKITVIMGEEDNFYLDGATRRLKEALEALGGDARILLVPGADHQSIIASEPFRNIMTEISEHIETASDAGTDSPVKN